MSLIELFSKFKVIRVELVLSASDSASVPLCPIELVAKFKAVRVELVLSASASARAPLYPIELYCNCKVVRVELAKMVETTLLRAPVDVRFSYAEHVIVRCRIWCPFLLTNSQVGPSTSKMMEW